MCMPMPGSRKTARSTAILLLGKGAAEYLRYGRKGPQTRSVKRSPGIPSGAGFFCFSLLCLILSDRDLHLLSIKSSQARGGGEGGWWTVTYKYIRDTQLVSSFKRQVTLVCRYDISELASRLFCLVGLKSAFSFLPSLSLPTLVTSPPSSSTTTFFV